MPSATRHGYRHDYGDSDGKNMAAPTTATERHAAATGWRETWEVLRLKQALETATNTLMHLRSDIAAAEVRVEDLNRDVRAAVGHRALSSDDERRPSNAASGNRSASAESEVAQHVANLRDTNAINDRIVSLHAQASTLEAARVALVGDMCVSRDAHRERMDAQRAKLRAVQFDQRTATMLLADQQHRLSAVAACNAHREAAFQKRMDTLHALARHGSTIAAPSASDDVTTQQRLPLLTTLSVDTVHSTAPSIQCLQASVDRARVQLAACEDEVGALRTEVAELEEVSRVRVELVLSQELEAKRDQLMVTRRAMQEALAAASEQRGNLQRTLDAAEGAVQAERRRIEEEQSIVVGGAKGATSTSTASATTSSMHTDDAPTTDASSSNWRRRYLDQLDVLRQKLQSTCQSTKEARHRQLAVRSKVMAVLPTEVQGARRAKAGSENAAAASLLELRERLCRQSAHLVSVNSLVEEARRERDALDAKAMHTKGAIEEQKNALRAMEGMMASFQSSMGSL